MLKAPPRLLLGVAFLFWGAMGEYPFVGLVTAILMEARHWTNLRWEFGEKGFVRAWQLCVIVLIVVAVRFFASDEEPTAEASLELLSWLPFIFLPLGLAQQYASDRGVPLTSFSYFARRKINQDRREGRAVKVKPCQIGFPFVGLILVSSGLGLRSVVGFGVGVAVIFGIGLYFMRERQVRPVAWGMAYLVSVVLAVGLSWAVYEIYGIVSSGRYAQSENFEDAREVETSMGKVRDLQLSPKVDWRYYQDEGKAPKRLRMAVYNIPGPNFWKAGRRSSALREKIDVDRDVGGDFETLHKREQDHLYEPGDEEKDWPVRGRVVGLVDDGALIPMPRNPRYFRNLSVEGVEGSSLGTARLSDPAHGALEIEIVSGEPDVISTGALDPTLRDMLLPLNELKGVTDFWERLGVDDLRKWTLERRGKVGRDWEPPTPDRREQEVLYTLLRAAFMRDFEYSLELRPNRNKPAVTHFLTEMKKGHCEYFAASTALLLRRAEIPTRYVVGYAVDEQGDEPGEWILRGRHAHAWAQAYLGGTWVNEAEEGKEPVWRCRGGEWVELDFTPPDWLGDAMPEMTWGQKVSDWWQMFQADLIVWFARPTVALITKVVLIGGLIFIILNVIYRLWTTGGRRGGMSATSWERRAVEGNPLREFERWLVRRFGSRPAGMPMGVWLEQYAPELVATYQELRFNPGSSEPGTEELDRLVESAREKIKLSAATAKKEGASEGHKES
ncbi:MAG: transglutaminase-like domain-containing protein [Verrucomicrobiaceae bacterium]